MRTSIGLKTFRIFAAALFAILCVLSTGCASTDPDNTISGRAWNRPKGWEGGLPVGLSEGR